MILHFKINNFTSKSWEFAYNLKNIMAFLIKKVVNDKNEEEPAILRQKHAIFQMLWQVAILWKSTFYDKKI